MLKTFGHFCLRCLDCIVPPQFTWVILASASKLGHIVTLWALHVPHSQLKFQTCLDLGHHVLQ